MRMVTGRWIWGLIPLGVLAMVMFAWRTEPIERELTNRANATLVSEGYSWASVSADGRDLTLNGVAPTPEAQADAADLVYDLWGVRIVENAATLLPEENPFTFSGSRSGSAVEIIGFVPDEDAETAVLQQFAELGEGIEVTDAVSLARGVPDAGRWVAATGLGASLLSKVSEGDFSLSDDTFTFSGKALSNDDYDAISELLAAAPAGLSIGDVRVERPTQSPFTWGIEKVGDTINATGYAPDEAAKAAYLEAVAAANPGLTINDKMELAAGAPDNWAETASFAGSFLSGVSGGAVSFTDTAMNVRGDAGSSSAYESARQMLNDSVPDGIELGDAVLGLPPQSPYLFGVERTGDGVRLSGFAPSIEKRAAIEAEARAAFPGLTIENDIELAAGQPADYDTLTAASLSLTSHLSNGSVSVTDSNLDVEGLASSTDDYAALRSELATLSEANELGSADVIPPLADNYRWSASLEGDTLTLDGFVPNDAAREAVLAAVRGNLPNVNVKDNMTLASGVPEDVRFEDAAFSALAALAQLDSGSAKLEGTSLEIVGESSREGALAEMPDAAEFASLGIGDTSVSVSPVTVSPYIFEADWQGWGIMLDGHVPTAEARESILSTVQRSFGSVEIEDALKVGAGAPDGFGAAVSAGLRQLGRLSAGKLSISDTSYAMEGIALTDFGAGQIRESFGINVPEAFTVDLALSNPVPMTPVDGPECQVLLNEALAQRTIYFEVGSAEINDDSVGILDQLIAVVTRCPEATLQIAGHTDSDGSDELNMTLSQARAETVTAYLSRFGVSSDRMSANGFGETQPVADNATEEGRAANRRIEFNVEVE